ncbi:hypothetical protein M426DRAFT_259557 [Hypoxylon sp. CI-4A]|nr:hypothetical protein M426DRAFT_259557 [Hypoxylon sp. CI-4A]
MASQNQPNQPNQPSQPTHGFTHEEIINQATDNMPLDDDEAASEPNLLDEVIVLDRRHEPEIFSHSFHEMECLEYWGGMVRDKDERLCAILELFACNWGEGVTPDSVAFDWRDDGNVHSRGEHMNHRWIPNPMRVALGGVFKRDSEFRIEWTTESHSGANEYVRLHNVFAEILESQRDVRRAWSFNSDDDNTEQQAEQQAEQQDTRSPTPSADQVN